MKVQRERLRVEPWEKELRAWGEENLDDRWTLTFATFRLAHIGPRVSMTTLSYEIPYGEGSALNVAVVEPGGGPAEWEEMCGMMHAALQKVMQLDSAWLN
jgi:hypothetical protein